MPAAPPSGVRLVIEDEHELHPPVTVSGITPPSSPFLTNWSGVTRLGRKSQIVRPSTTSEIADLLRSRPTTSVRVVGSGLSFEPIAAVDDDRTIIIQMSNFNGLEHWDPETHTARFGAGTPVDEIISILASKGRMLPCSPGVIGMQTIAGAISTATHGQGLRQSSLSDAVIGLEVVQADGSVISVDKGDPRLGAYAASLGVLGVIRSVTLETAPERQFLCRKFSASFDDFAGNWLAWNRESEFCKAWWYPETSLVHVWRIDEITDKKMLESGDVDVTLNETVDILTEKMAVHTRDPGLVGCQFATINRFRNTTNQTGRLHEVVTKGIPVPQINCEIAIPLHRLDESLQALVSWLKVNGTESLHYPFIFRCTGQSSTWISPASPGPACFIGFLVYLPADAKWTEDSMPLMRSLQSALVDCGGVPHLGKHFCTDLWRLPDLLPKWHAFAQLRQSVDPAGRFLNPFLRTMFNVTNGKQ
ncbi:FAD-binding PCMH-type domain-containing protein [Plasmodiophora brassicae]|uniref:FAD-binding PCMH-type domain-containing protein n=1 Tax=Plasmodiophora brassicae TaxID=37360 RepID=A0A0G4J6N0_PLABS|nr:hypothetical protein PBRA_003007 [Plasmodiophora brassicae]